MPYRPPRRSSSPTPHVPRATPHGPERPLCGLRSGRLPKAPPTSRRRLWPSRHRCRHGRSHLGCLLGYGVQRNELGRRLPHTTLEGDCTAEGTSIRTAEGEDACVYKRTEPAPAVYPAVWFPPLDFDSGIIKVGVGGVYKDDAAAKTGMRNLETGVDKSETDMDKSDSQTYE